jgi:PIN domain nuclease of toxin-antitoxin system
VTLLVDTHAWLWFLLTPNRLSEAAVDALSDRQNALTLSVASEWEKLPIRPS